MLDTTYLRSPWERDSNTKDCSAGNIVPTGDEDTTVLGEAQWSWIEQQFKESVALYIFVSGIQVIPVDHRFERWAGIPHERHQLLQLLSQANDHRKIFCSDRHLAGTSRSPSNVDQDIDKELLEFTASARTSRVGWGRGGQNRYLVTDDNISGKKFLSTNDRLGASNVYGGKSRSERRNTATVPS